MRCWLAVWAGLMVMAAAPAALAEKRVALVLGNAAYQNTTPLTSPTHDAADLAAVLSRLGFDVVEGSDLDKRAMERTMRQFTQKLARADVALFYFAGHALQSGGQNYLMPIDARLRSEGDVDFEAVPLALVLRQMEREAKTSIVLLDACRDNPLARGLARTLGTRASLIGQGLAEVKAGVGTLVGLSTQPGNIALEGEGRNSPYAKALLKHVEAPGKDVSGVLVAVRNDVLQATAGKQVPWEFAALTDEVYLRAAPAAAAIPAGSANAIASPLGPAARRHRDGAAARLRQGDGDRILECHQRQQVARRAANLPRSLSARHLRRARPRHAGPAQAGGDRRDSTRGSQGCRSAGCRRRWRRPLPQPAPWDWHARCRPSSSGSAAIQGQRTATGAQRADRRSTNLPVSASLPCQPASRARQLLRASPVSWGASVRWTAARVRRSSTAPVWQRRGRKSARRSHGRHGRSRSNRKRRDFVCASGGAPWVCARTSSREPPALATVRVVARTRWLPRGEHWRSLKRSLLGHYSGQTGAWLPNGTGGRVQRAGVLESAAAWRT